MKHKILISLVKVIKYIDGVLRIKYKVLGKKLQIKSIMNFISRSNIKKMFIYEN